MSMYEIDSAYVRRCQKRLQEWGAPLSGWYCDYIYDVADEEEDPDHIDHNHLVRSGACDACLETFKECWEEYVRCEKKKLKRN